MSTEVGRYNFNHGWASNQFLVFSFLVLLDQKHDNCKIQWILNPVIWSSCNTWFYSILFSKDSFGDGWTYASSGSYIKMSLIRKINDENIYLYIFYSYVQIFIPYTILSSLLLPFISKIKWSDHKNTVLSNH